MGGVEFGNAGHHNAVPQATFILNPHRLVTPGSGTRVHCPLPQSIRIATLATFIELDGIGTARILSACGRTGASVTFPVTGWSSADYDQLLFRAARTSDNAARDKLLQQAEALLLDAAPFVPLYHYTHVFLIHPSVKGWHPTLLDHHPYKHVHLEN